MSVVQDRVCLCSRMLLAEGSASIRRHACIHFGNFTESGSVEIQYRYLEFDVVMMNFESFHLESFCEYQSDKHLFWNVVTAA